MHRNENKYDQLFRNRVRDLSHPVRNELWSRIHSGIKARTASALRQPIHKLWLSPATSISVAAAALAITFGIIHFTHTATPPSPRSVSSVTLQDSSRGHSNVPTTAVIPRTTPPLLSSAVHTASSTASPSNGLSPATAVIPKSHFTTRDRLTTRDHHISARHHHVSQDPAAHDMSTTTETMPGTELSTHRHNPNPVTLPAMARTYVRAAITAGAPGSKSRHAGSNGPGNWPPLPPFHRTGYISLYASPDFPNHYYTWSHTLGARLTFQFSRRWSFTAGFEYARVNVPTQVVPPIGYGDTLHSFYFSNYEIPALFGYTRSFHHATLTISGGAILNMYFHQSTGAWVFNWPDRDSYGAVLGIDYTYALVRHLAIFAEPYARYSISDYRMFIQAQRWSFGTLLGIKFQL